MNNPLSLALIFAGLATASVSAQSVPAQGTPMRVVAANLTSGPDQSYDPGHGIRILSALKPDVVLIQEFRYEKGPLEGLVDLIAGPGMHHFKEPGYRLANGVISRWPIVDSGSWKDPVVTDRGMAWSRIDVPGPKDLWAISLHLKSGSHESSRNSQAAELVRNVKSKVPSQDYLVLGGDFNTQARNEGCVKVLANIVVVAGGHPHDQQGREGTNASRAKPYDWVLADDDLDVLHVPIHMGPKVFKDGLVVDTRVSPALPLTGVQEGDSDAENMQHMAVVRDFVLPAK